METRRNKQGKITGYREKVYLPNGESRHGPTFRTKSLARQWKQFKLREINEMKVKGIYYNEESYLKDVSKKFLQYKASRVGDSSMRAYKIALEKWIIPIVGNKEISKIREIDADKVESKMTLKGRKPNTKNKVLKTFKMVTKFALKKEMTLRDGLKDYELIKVPSKEIVFWRLDECSKFLQATEYDEYFDVYFFALNTGCRLAEILGLQWDSVNLERGELVIKRQLKREGLVDETKSRKVRVVPMTEKIHKMLSERFKNRKNLSYVFTKENGERIDREHFTYRYFYKAIKKAKVRKIQFKDLRSTFGSHYCMREQGSIFELSKILGHHSVVITERSYARFHPDYLREGMRSFSIDFRDNRPILAPLNKH